MSAGEGLALSLQGITKRFGALVANDNIWLDLKPGEVLALLGENGAGKSTLVSILFGHYRADAGRIEVFGQPLPPGQPRAALAAGIGMVHQHFTLADNLSVLDNLLLGAEPLWQPFSRRAAARQSLVDTARRFGLQVEPDARVAELSVGQRQRVEILKALTPMGRRTGARVLILDEPTAVLTPAEVESLFATLQQLVAQGLSVIFISHKLDEVLQVSHRVAVLRAGRLVAQLPTHEVGKARLASLMVGREVTPPQRQPRLPGAQVCSLQNVTVRGVSGRGGLVDASLALHAGEIVGIAGVSGNGQQALAGLLCGLQPAEAGTVRLGIESLPAHPRAWVRAGVARIPEDRHAVATVGDLPLWENAVLERYAMPAYSRFGVMRRAAARALARQIVERYDVRGTEVRGVDTPVRSLSGGNMQKLILGRTLMTAPRPASTPADPPGGSGPAWGGPALGPGGMTAPRPAGTPADPPRGSGPAWGGPALGPGGMTAPRPAGTPGDPSRGSGAASAAPVLIVADQPTWGLDVGAVAYVHQQLLDACAQGAAVLLISEDLDELFALADRVAVLHAGHLGEARPTAHWTRASIGLAMAGAADSHVAEAADAA